MSIKTVTYQIYVVTGVRQQISQVAILHNVLFQVSLIFFFISLTYRTRNCFVLMGHNKVLIIYTLFLLYHTKIFINLCVLELAGNLLNIVRNIHSEYNKYVLQNIEHC